MVRTSIVPYKQRICNLVRVPVQINTMQYPYSTCTRPARQLVGAAPTALCLHGRPAGRLIRWVRQPPRAVRASLHSGEVAAPGVRVLFRMDSAVSVGAINRRGSMVPHFNALVLQLMELLETLGSEAVARHLPGKENVLSDGISLLSDGISRLSGKPDPSD